MGILTITKEDEKATYDEVDEDIKALDEAEAEVRKEGLEDEVENESEDGLKREKESEVEPSREFGGKED